MNTLRHSLYVKPCHNKRHVLVQVYITMQMLLLHDEGFDKSVATALTWQREWTEADWSILSVIDTVLTGQATGDEQMAVQLDRALATSGSITTSFLLHKHYSTIRFAGLNWSRSILAGSHASAVLHWTNPHSKIDSKIVCSICWLQ